MIKKISAKIPITITNPKTGEVTKQVIKQMTNLETGSTTMTRLDPEEENIILSELLNEKKAKSSTANMWKKKYNALKEILTKYCLEIYTDYADCEDDVCEGEYYTYSEISTYLEWEDTPKDSLCDIYNSNERVRKILKERFNTDIKEIHDEK